MLSKLRASNAKSKETESEKDFDVVCDLDQIVPKKGKVTLNGEVHYLKPVSTLEFLVASRTMALLDRIEANPYNYTIEDIRVAYFEFIRSVCDTITKDHLDKMHYVQLGALMKAVLHHITGGIKLPTDGVEKKKEIMREPGLK